MFAPPKLTTRDVFKKLTEIAQMSGNSVSLQCSIAQMSGNSVSLQCSIAQISGNSLSLQCS